MGDDERSWQFGGQVGKVTRDPICAISHKTLIFETDGDAKTARAGGAGGADAVGRVLDDDGTVRVDAKPRSRQEEYLRVGLFPLHVVAGDDRLEGLGCDADFLEVAAHLDGVGAG